MPPESSEPSPSQDPQLNVPEQSEQPSPPATPPVAPANNKKKLYTVVAIVIVLLLAVGAYFMFMKKDNSDQVNQQAQQTETKSEDDEMAAEEPEGCAEGTTEFAGDNIGLHFCYPVTWGNAELVDGQEASHTEVGSVKKITFSKNSTVHAGLTSKDWKHNDMGHDGGEGHGNISFAQHAEAKDYIKASYVYADTDSQLAYITSCYELCSLKNNESGVLLVYGVKIPDNPTYELIVFYQDGPAFGSEFMEDPSAEKPFLDFNKVESANLTELMPKTDSRFTVLQALAGTVRN